MTPIAKHLPVNLNSESHSAAPLQDDCSGIANLEADLEMRAMDAAGRTFMLALVLLSVAFLAGVAVGLVIEHRWHIL